VLACTGLAFFFGVVVGEGVTGGDGVIVSVGVGILVEIRVGILVGMRGGSGVLVGIATMLWVCCVSATGAVYVLPVEPPDEPPPP
jgi:hypothetical protein